MINPSHIATGGYLNSPFSVATSGYLYITETVVKQIQYSVSGADRYNNIYPSEVKKQKIVQSKQIKAKVDLYLQQALKEDNELVNIIIKLVQSGEL